MGLFGCNWCLEGPYQLLTAQKHPIISTLGTKPNLTPLFPVQALLTSKNT